MTTTTKTYTDNAHFTAVSGGSVADGSFKIQTPTFGNATLDTYAANLIAAWHLDETSGTRAALVGPSLNNIGSSIGYAAGKNGNAITGGGTANTYAYSATEIFKGLSKCSVSAWVYFSSLTNQQFIVMERYSPGGRVQIGKNSSNQLLVNIRDGDGTQRLSASTNTFSAEQWYHVFVVIDASATGGTINAWINNSAWITDATGATSGINNTAGYGVSILAADNASSPLNGRVDEVCVWNEALATSSSYDVVTALYNSGTGRFCDFGGVCEINDSGSTIIDLGAGNRYLDCSTLSASTTGSPTVSLRYKSSDDSGAMGDWSSALSVAEFQALSDISKRYFDFEISLEDTGTCSLDALSFDAVTVAPSAPTVTGDALTTDSTPTWSWSSNAGAEGTGDYRYQLDGTGGAWTETTDTSYTPGTALSHGVHTLYVQEKGTNDEWSASGSFAITVDLVAPAPPVVSGEASTTDTTPTWTWTAGGGGNGTFRYQVDGTGGSWTETTDLEYTPGSPLSIGDHTLYVQERDTAGNWSVEGHYTTTITEDVPSAPTVSVSSPTFDTTPEVTVTPGGGGNGTFRYKLGSRDWAEVSATVFSISPLLAAGVYTLEVQESNVSGAWSDSGTAALTVRLNTSDVRVNVSYEEGDLTGTLVTGRPGFGGFN